MDDEAKQLLREIRDAVLRNEERYQKVTTETLAADTKWKEEIRSNMKRSQNGVRVIAGIICIGTILALLVWAISSLDSPKPPAGDVIQIPGRDPIRVAPGILKNQPVQSRGTARDLRAINPPAPNPDAPTERN